MATNKYRVGIIGCGGMGNAHANAWANHEQAEVVAAMDIDREAAQRLADAHSAKVYKSSTKMIKDEGLDIVSITTWQSVRAKLTVQAAKAGVRGIFGEKPMCASVGEADDMIAACEKHGVKLAIGHQRRFNPQNCETRQLIQEGAIGEPQVVIRRNAGGLLNRGTHEIDEAGYVLGDPKPLWVIGQTSRTTDKWERRVRCEDLCMGLICCEGGARVIYEGDLPEPGLAGFTVYGSEGQVVRGPDGTILLLNDVACGWQTIRPREAQPSQYEEFIDWMDGRIEEHRNTGRQSRVVMELMMAIYESLRIKGVVQLPLQTRENPLDLLVEDGTLPVLVEGRYDIRAPFPEQK